jgi:hypothetical protein
MNSKTKPRNIADLTIWTLTSRKLIIRISDVLLCLLFDCTIQDDKFNQKC